MRKILYYIVISIGLLQTIGYLTKIKIIRDIGVVTTASPLPIVFTEVKGVETFASDFYLLWTNDQNEQEEVKITPALYSKLKGPYNRRNIFGAAIAYGPVLPKKIWDPILNYGLCENILSEELGIPINKENFSLLIKTRTEGKTDEWTLITSCE
jgi:hypothetical protein